MPRLIALSAAALLGASSARADNYWVTLNLTTDLDHVFVYADEWNGQVYAWDLFPLPLGTVHAGVSSFPLGNRNIKAWAIIATHGTSGVTMGINSSIPPPDGSAFESVFPGYLLGTVQSNIATLYNGAFNTPQAFYLTEYVLASEDTLKTDLPVDSLTMYTFNNATNVGTISFSSTLPCLPNCDNSTAAPILNALDFSCFLTKFAASDPYANCDGSTAAPMLNALDFGCFLTRFAAGCT